MIIKARLLTRLVCYDVACTFLASDGNKILSDSSPLRPINQTLHRVFGSKGDTPGCFALAARTGGS